MNFRGGNARIIFNGVDITPVDAGDLLTDDPTFRITPINAEALAGELVAVECEPDACDTCGWEPDECECNDPWICDTCGWSER